MLRVDQTSSTWIKAGAIDPLQTLPAWRPDINMVRTDVRALPSCI